MAISEWMDKEDVAYAYSGILFSPKKRWNLAIMTTRMSLEGIKRNKLGEERQIPWFHS